MYGRGAGSVVGSTVVTGTGVVMLPSTSGNTIGSILAYTAISIGAMALLSQIAVRILRHVYRAQ
jgi:hypothetical protein